MTLPALEVSTSSPTTVASPLSELQEKLETLQRDYAELNTSIFEAAQVHRRLCAPSLVRHGAFDVATEIFAVRHLPGDFVSVEQTRDGLVLALGDIGGKGLAAGMWVTHLIGLLRSHTAASTDPDVIVAGINRDVTRLSSVEPLSTLFVARLAKTGRVDYTSAGHPPALLLRQNGQLELLSDGGPVLGAVSTARFERGSMTLRGGDLLLSCSDGILESFNEAEQEFGNMRLQTELRRAQGGSAEAVLFSVLGAVQDFAAPRPLTDDMTLMVVKRNR